MTELVAPRIIVLSFPFCINKTSLFKYRDKTIDQVYVKMIKYVNIEMVILRPGYVRREKS